MYVCMHLYRIRIEIDAEGCELFKTIYIYIYIYAATVSVLMY